MLYTCKRCRAARMCPLVQGLHMEIILQWNPLEEHSYRANAQNSKQACIVIATNAPARQRRERQGIQSDTETCRIVRSPRPPWGNKNALDVDTQRALKNYHATT